MISSICGFSIDDIEAKSRQLLEEHNQKGIRPKQNTLSNILEDQLNDLERIAENLDKNLDTKRYCYRCARHRSIDRNGKCRICAGNTSPYQNTVEGFGDNTRITDKHLADYDNKTEEQKEKIKLKNTKENIKNLQKIKKKLFDLSQKKEVQTRKKLNISSYEITCQRIEKALRKIITETISINTDSMGKTKPDLDRKLVKQLSKVFDNVNQARMRNIVIKGKTPNVSRYIKAQSTPTRKIFNQNIQNKNPFTIYILLDQSQSMGANTRIASTLINSFYESVKFNKKIKIKVLGFEGWEGSIELNYVDKQSKLGLINYSGGGTPTCEALTYIKSIMEKDNGKKLFILVSDGYPQPPSNVDSIYPSVYIKTLINDMKNKKDINAFGVLVGNGNFEDYSAIFGENFAQFDQFEKAGDLLTKIFSKYVTEYLQD